MQVIFKSYANILKSVKLNKGILRKRKVIRWKNYMNKEIKLYWHF